MAERQRHFQTVMKHLTNFVNKVKTYRIKRINFQKLATTMCLRRCCCCCPLKCGVALLFVIQMACLTPFTVHSRSRQTLFFAVFLMLLLLVASIIFMYAIVWEKCNYLPATVYLSFSTLIFHFVMINYNYLEYKTRNAREDAISFLYIINDIFSILAYFYLLIMLYNTYVEMAHSTNNQQL
jgi:hypothetical protein